MEIIRHPYQTRNAGALERAVTIAAGTALMWSALRRKRNWQAAALALAGGNFLRWGVTGYSWLNQKLGINTRASGRGRNTTLPYELGLRVDEAVTIARPRAGIYQLWRDLERLPSHLRHVESIHSLAAGLHSHWIVRGPQGRRFEWDAEIIRDVENELIAWRTLQGSDVASTGSVRFTDAGGDRGTEVRVELQYNPPGGIASALAAKWFGAEASQLIREDLQRLKTGLEAGVYPSTEGQPMGTAANVRRGVSNGMARVEQSVGRVLSRKRCAGMEPLKIRITGARK